MCISNGCDIQYLMYVSDKIHVSIHHYDYDCNYVISFQIDIINNPFEFEIQHAICDCLVGLSEGCGHIIGLLFKIASLKTLGCLYVPEDVVRTSQPGAWRIPRGEKWEKIQNVEVYSYKTRNEVEDPPKPVTSTLCNLIRITVPSPLELYHPLEEAHPNSIMLDLLVERVQDIQLVATKFGPMRRGIVISYQQ